MKRSYIKIIPAVALGVLSFFLLFSQSRALACGPFFPDYIYTPEDIFLISSPQYYNPNFSDETPGIIFSSWRIQFLYPVYQALNGKRPVEAQADPSGGAAEEKSGREQWIEARKTVTDRPMDIQVWATGDYYESFLSYLNDSFLTAATTLKERKKSFSKEEMNLWLEGQDEVFGDTTGRLFDEQLDAKITNPLLRYDREYQRAAVRFYHNNFEEAGERFSRIAVNPDQPWRAYAALAVGRTFIRKANAEYDVEMNKHDNNLAAAVAVRNEWLKKAAAQFEYVLKDKALEPVHASAQRLLDYTTFRLDPRKRLLDAEKTMSTSSDPAETERNLRDFYLTYNSWGDETTKKDFILQNGGDFAQWVFLWKNGKPELADFAAERYRKTKSLAWLIACLRLMPPNLSGQEEILRDAAKIPATSPAYLTGRYYYFLFLLKSGSDKEKIVQELDRFLKTIDGKKNPAAWDCFVDLRMFISQNLEESLRYSTRKVTPVSEGETYQPFSTDIALMDKKIKRVFNESLPLEEWVIFALRDDLFPPYISRHLRLTAFVRAVLLDRLDTAEKIARKLSAAEPALKNDLSAFLKTGSPEEKKFAAGFFILRYPRLNAVLDLASDEIMVENLPMNKLDIFRRNWWRWEDGNSYLPYYYGFFDNEQGKLYDAAYLNKLLPTRKTEEAARENQKMRGIAAPNFLADTIIKYAAGNPNDPRVPEALHLAVRATRYAGFMDKETSGYSKKAFLLLHRQYPNNPWTGKTPYWY